MKLPPTLAAFAWIFPPKFRQWAGPLATVTVVAVVVAIVMLVTGVLAFPASTADPEGFTGIVHAVFKRSVATHSDDLPVPGDLDAAWRVQLGAAYFARTCAACHGEPGKGQNPVVLSMRPRPQYLPAVIGQFKPAEMFWIVKHGVKFSAMPAWPTQARDDEVWSVVAFLRQIARMSPQQYAFYAYGPEEDEKGESAASATAARGGMFAENNADEGPTGDFRYTWPNAPLRANAGGSDSCDSCHGEDGAGRPGGGAPNLTIQKPDYILAALRSFASGSRPGAVMQTMATAMSPHEMAEAATYFGGKGKPWAGQTAAPPSSALRMGQAIATQGIAARRIAACAGCHGIEGASKIGFPALAGQNPIFLAEQLNLYRLGVRGKTVGYDPMSAASHLLTDREVAAVSAYYASLPPGKPPLAKVEGPMASHRPVAAASNGR